MHSLTARLVLSHVLVATLSGITTSLVVAFNRNSGSESFSG